MHSFRLFLFLLSGLLVSAVVSAQQPGLTVDRFLGPVRVGVSGVPGQDYTLEASTNFTDWSFLLRLPLTSDAQSWFDSSSVLTPSRFYRAVESSDSMGLASDFRLIDHLGHSRWLFYYQNDPSIQTSVKAITLIFTGNGCGKIREMIPTIKALTNQFNPQGVLFWLIDSNQGDNRSNILVEATSLGISNGPPILHDAAQLVARAYHASNTPEAVAIDTVSWSIFYRGAIDDRLASNAVSTTQYYLSNALVNFLASQPVSPSQSVPAGCAVSLKPSFTNISYSTEIAPLLAAKCVRCHSPGNVAPWAMTNYNIVADFSFEMRREIMAGRMPPWHADPNYGVFTNDFSLKSDEAAKLVQWIGQGAPRGSGPDPLAAAMPTTNYPFAWPTNLGAPDAILRIPAQSIPATGIVDYRYINVANTAFPSNVWLRAAVARPTNVKVVHHCLVFDGSSSGTGLDGFFSGYVPGADPAPFPPNSGKLLTNGQILRFQMHYITIGSNQTDQTELGLYLAPAPPDHPLQTKSAYSLAIFIPPNSSTYQLSASFPASGTLATNILMFEMDPHMHFRGDWFKFEAVYSTGARETLLSVPNYAFRWQSSYRLAQPKYLPKGTKIVCTGGYDNTSQNNDLMDAYATTGQSGFNPNGSSVTFGEQSFNEMFIGYFNYVELPGPPP